MRNHFRHSTRSPSIISSRRSTAPTAKSPDRTALPNFVNYRDPDGNLIYGDYCVYDGNGRIVSIADSGNTSSVRATYGYDEQGQLTSAAVGGTRYAYTYDTAGNLITKTDGGTSHSYTYGNGKGGQYEHRLHLRHGRGSQQQDRGQYDI